MLQRLYDFVDRVWLWAQGWRTVLFGSLLAMSGAVLAILELFGAVDLSLFFSPRTAAFANIAIGIAVIALRYYTTTPVGEKPEGE